jgi:hypothetical protein
MTPAQINRQLARAGSVVVGLNQIAALREAALLAAEQLPVRWTFEPGTPATLVDYLAGGVQGAFKGAAAGLGVEILLAALFPAAAFGYLLLGGAVLGAMHGVTVVHQGWRLRLVYAPDGAPLLYVQRLAA